MWFSVSRISILISNMLFPSHPHGWPSSTKVLDVTAAQPLWGFQSGSAGGHRRGLGPRGQLGWGSLWRPQPPMS